MPRSKSICIVGSGAAGLITAHTLLEDGFTNVSIISRDRSCGGVWENDKVYAGFRINVHGEYRFSPLSNARPSSSKQGKHLTAVELRTYFETFVETYLKNKIIYHTEVLSISRAPNDQGWLVLTEDTLGGPRKQSHYDKIVLCTGGCSEPRVPEYFSPDAARDVDFHGPVVHSSHFKQHLEEVLVAVKPASDTNPGEVVVIGGGKSAQDIATYLAHRSRRRNVTVVFEAVDAVFASTVPIPNFVRKSRLMGLLSPHIDLNSKLERFLHNTSIGSAIVRGFWQFMTWNSFRSLKVPKDSPLRQSHSLFWGLRPNDEPVGPEIDDGFYQLANSNQIRLVGPCRAIGLHKDGHSVELEDGRTIKADAVILATGYTSSWGNIFDQETMDAIGLGKHTPRPGVGTNEWNYRTLRDPPKAHPESHRWMASVYRGIVPAENILKRDLAINGAVFSANNGYIFETISHWISAYFLEDTLLTIPATPREATDEADRTSAWLRKRYPSLAHWTNASHSSVVLSHCWPQYADLLMKDMGLERKNPRSGGNLLTWPFKTIHQTELETLGRERKLQRQQVV